jgi:Zn-dependent protease/predicted transcriptional regulator
MHAQLRIGSVGGVPIAIHLSWVIIAVLLTLSLAAHFQATNGQWGREAIWLCAVLAALLFFASIVVHELSHAAVARSNGVPVKGITLFALGGVAQIERDAADAKTEFWMGIVGPLTSAAIGAACLGAALALGWDPGTEPANPAVAVLKWLGYINVMLAVFNMIPGFPLDGGRVLRAILWWKNGSLLGATRTAARIGERVALLFIILGVVRFFLGEGVAGLWLAFIGWFLLNASRENYQQVEATMALRGLSVSDLMARDCPAVDARTNLREFVEEHVIRTGRRCFLVLEHDYNVVGLVTPDELKHVPHRRWPFTTIEQVMRPLAALRTIPAETSASEALQVMMREDLRQLPVMRNGRLEGVVSRGHILNAAATRAELQM